MADNKRKQPPGASHGGSAPKKSRGGGGKWKTPHYEAKMAHKVEVGTAIEVGDQGLWVTYARGMRTKAMREMYELCEEYGEKMYGIPRQDADKPEGNSDEDEPEDIEASIKKELNDLKDKKTKPKEERVFTIIPADIECVFFVRTLKPVQPVDLVRQICIDARDSTDVMQRKVKYINRLTPVNKIDKASEKRLAKVAREAMAPYFRMAEQDGTTEAEESADAEDKPVKPDEDSPNFTYAIRPTIRSHSALKSGEVIKQVANLPLPEHKVNLTSPDKVILIDIYQSFCGASVVDGVEWENLKRYNLNELYRLVAAKSEDTAEKTEKQEPEEKAD